MTQNFLPTFKSLARVCFPLTLMALSSNMMQLIDRLVLARVSLETMNAAAAASMVVNFFQFGAMAIASIAEVFVGQHNGAEAYDRVAEPVWQMIWFSLATFLLFIPLGLMSGPFFIPSSFHQEGMAFFQISMAYSGLMPLITSLASFYIGRGETSLVTSSTIISILLNLLLNLIFVFGFEPFIPALGATGSAIATFIATLFQTLMMAIFFLNKQNRQLFNTHKPTFSPQVLWACLKIGAPGAGAHMIEISGWALVFHLIIATSSTEQVTILTIGASILYLYAYLTEGLSKAVIAFSSNLLGAHKFSYINQLINSALMLHLLLIFVLAVFFLIFPDSLITLFIPEAAYSEKIVEPLLVSMKWLWLFCIFDGIIWIYAGILTSAGDTRYMMIVNSLSVWFFNVLPIYLLLQYQLVDSLMVWRFTALSGFVNMLVLIWRYRSQRWYKLALH